MIAGIACSLEMVVCNGHFLWCFDGVERVFFLKKALSLPYAVGMHGHAAKLQAAQAGLHF